MITFACQYNQLASRQNPRPDSVFILPRRHLCPQYGSDSPFQSFANRHRKNDPESNGWCNCYYRSPITTQRCCDGRPLKQQAVPRSTRSQPTATKLVRVCGILCHSMSIALFTSRFPQSSQDLSLVAVSSVTVISNTSVVHFTYLTQQDECDRLTAVAMKQTLGRQVVSTVLVKHILLLQCGPQAGAGRRPAPAPAAAPACGLARPAGPRWPLHAGIYQRRSRRIG